MALIESRNPRNIPIAIELSICFRTPEETSGDANQDFRRTVRIYVACVSKSGVWRIRLLFATEEE